MMNKKVFIADEPTFEELNEMVKYFYQELAFGAILKNGDTDKAIDFLIKLSDNQLRELSLACAHLGDIISKLKRT